MIYVKDFNGATVAEQIQSAIYAASQSQTSKTVQLEEKDYYLESTIRVLENVELLFGYGSRIVVGANVPIFEVHRNAAVINPYIAIDVPEFDAPVFLLDGKHKYYNTWNKTAIKDGVVVNWTGSHKGVGFRFFSGGDGHEISFVHVSNVKLVGLRRAIELEAKKPATGMAWVNANNFSNIAIDDCVEMIVINGSETVPNECSGNIFTGLQLQPSSETTQVLKVTGQHNRFDGMLWDVGLISTQQFVEVTEQSANTRLDFNGSLPSARVKQAGKSITIL